MLEAFLGGDASVVGDIVEPSFYILLQPGVQKIWLAVRDRLVLTHPYKLDILWHFEPECRVTAVCWVIELD
jgi:hypothetical protein